MTNFTGLDLHERSLTATTLAARGAVATGGFARPLVAKRFSAYVGVCPLDSRPAEAGGESGESVRRRPTSGGTGRAPSGSCSHPRAVGGSASVWLVGVEGSAHRGSYRRKVAKGKSGRLVLDNVENKLLRVMAAVLRDGRPYEPAHVSVGPRFSGRSP